MLLIHELDYLGCGTHHGNALYLGAYLASVIVDYAHGLILRRDLVPLIGRTPRIGYLGEYHAAGLTAADDHGTLSALL